MGGIHEHDSKKGDSNYLLAEGWAGGELALGGAVKLTNPVNEASGGWFGFLGTGFNLGPAAGFQIGIMGWKDWGGLYIEGHVGTFAWGGSGYVSPGGH